MLPCDLKADVCEARGQLAMSPPDPSAPASLCVARLNERLIGGLFLGHRVAWRGQIAGACRAGGGLACQIWTAASHIGCAAAWRSRHRWPCQQCAAGWSWAFHAFASGPHVAPKSVEVVAMMQFLARWAARCRNSQVCRVRRHRRGTAGGPRARCVRCEHAAGMEPAGAGWRRRNGVVRRAR